MAWYGEWKSLFNSYEHPVVAPYTVDFYNKVVSGYDKNKYKTMADYAKAVDFDEKFKQADYSDRAHQKTGDFDNGEYFKSMTNHLSLDDKVETFITSSLPWDHFKFDDGSSYTRSPGNQTRLKTKGARYWLQEELGETVEHYVQRRSDSQRRDKLRQQMLKEKDIIDGGKSVQQTKKPSDLG